MEILHFLNNGIPFAKYLGIEITGLSAEGAEALLPEREVLSNHIGTQHAAALFALAEAASGASIVAMFGQEIAGLVPVVRNASIDYRAKARGPIRAHARIAAPSENIRDELRKKGRADIVVDVSLFDREDREIATTKAVWNVRSAEVSRQ